MAGGLVPYLTKPELRKRAAAFLGQHHPTDTIPVPIEEIVEFKLNLDIVPVPGLMSGGRGINGYLSSDRTTIYVDEWLFRNVEARYLFTLAHEVAHLVLHGHLYRGFRSDEEWKAFHQRLAVQHGLPPAEYQANTLAGLILVPESHLVAVATERFRALAAVVLAEEPGFDLTGEAFWDYVAQEVAKAFRVSAETARIRLQADTLWGQRLQ